MYYFSVLFIFFGNSISMDLAGMHHEASEFSSTTSDKHREQLRSLRTEACVVRNVDTDVVKRPSATKSHTP